MFLFDDGVAVGEGWVSFLVLFFRFSLVFLCQTLLHFASSQADQSTLGLLVHCSILRSAGAQGTCVGA